VLSVGIDLGQARDATAIVALESYRPELQDSAEAVTSPGQRVRARPRRELHHEITYIGRLRVGLSYPAQVEAIAGILDSLAGEERPRVAIDATGVGRPVVDLLRQGCAWPLTAVTITGANEVASHGQSVAVPKTELVSCLEVTLAGRRLHAAPGLALAPDLEKELRAFSYELSASGRPLYEGRGSHDDLVLALCLGLYLIERGTPGEGFRSYMYEQIARRQAAQPA
jgi:hypothetical protein